MFRDKGREWRPPPRRPSPSHRYGGRKVQTPGISLLRKINPSGEQGGFRGQGGRPPPLRQVITQKKAKCCCSQTVKSNVLLSQNAGNAISETLDVQNIPGGMPSRARASDDRYAVDRPPPLSKMLDPPLEKRNLVSVGEKSASV